MHHITSTITNDLYFNMSEAVDRSLFGKDLLRGTLLDSSSDEAFEVFHLSNESDASASSTINGFDHDGEAVLRCELANLFDIAGGWCECR